MRITWSTADVSTISPVSSADHLPLQERGVSYCLPISTLVWKTTPTAQAGAQYTRAGTGESTQSSELLTVFMFISLGSRFPIQSPVVLCNIKFVNKCRTLVAMERQKKARPAMWCAETTGIKLLSCRNKGASNKYVMIDEGDCPCCR